MLGADIPLGGTNEPAIAVNPTNSLNIAAASLFELRVSTDGGATFGPSIPTIVDAGQVQCGDPSLGFDSQGRLFWTYLGCTPDVQFLDIYIAQSNPTTGAILSGYPINVTASPGINKPALSGFSHDKEWLAVDASLTSPFRDHLYIVWTEFASIGTIIWTTSSSDLGLTWSSPIQLSTGAEGFVWPCHNTVAPNGDVYVAYHSQPFFNFVSGDCNSFPDGNSGRVVVHRSTDGGASFPQKSLAFQPGQADMTFNVQTSSATIPGAPFWLQGSVQPWILADPITPGRIYVIANDDPDNDPLSGDPADVFIAISTDNGLTWSVPSRVDSGPGTTFQVMPTAAIDRDTGCIVVHYYDNRNGNTNANGNFLLDVYYTVSRFQGLGFSFDLPINDVPIDPDLGAGCRFDCNGDPNCPTPTLRIGEYNGVAIANDTLHAVWRGNTAFGQQVIYDNVSGVCQAGVEVTKFSQPPTGDGEDIASNIDWVDTIPNIVGADDFISDGRPIVGIRWWGSALGGPPALDPDGWFISLHQPVIEGGSAAAALAVYFCDASIVTPTTTALGACDGSPVIDYGVSLTDCCLLHANADSRSGLVVAQRNAFFEQQCFEYAIDIQAVMGHKYMDDGSGLCGSPSLTGRVATGDFWGWHTTGIARGTSAGLRPAFQTPVSMSAGDWLYGPWMPVTPTCSQPNMAFELITNAPTPGNPDVNDNGVPDICECPALNPLEPDRLALSGNPPNVENRFLSIVPGNAGSRMALRVTFVSLPPPFDALDGQTMWVGQPREICENSGSGPNVAPANCGAAPGIPSPTFFASVLQCTPFFNDWSTTGAVHIHHEFIVPGGMYDIQAIEESCEITNNGNFSTPLSMETSRWGDVMGSSLTCPLSPPAGIVNVTTDVTSVLDKFSNRSCALTKTRADVEPADVDFIINITDVTKVLDAFGSIPYPFAPSTTCACLPCP